MTKRTDLLLNRSGQWDTAPADARRHEELIEQAVSAGRTREFAELIYEVASEEGVDPVVAFEVVLSGVGVRELGGSLPDQWAEAQVEAPPPWVGDGAFHAAPAMGERLVRTTFRRLRSVIENSASLELAMRAFVQEPDVGDVEY